jgi:hypothetical protein
MVPGDALVYLETQDLGKALQAVTDNDAFRAAAKSQPDFSALNGIKVGVAVTGFETKEEKVSDENSVLNFQPRFVAVAETNAWNYQTITFAENKLGEFVNDIYGGGVELERFPRYDGDYFVWTADDGRKAYGLVIGSVIFFGNDETAIEKCVAVRKGEGESIAKNSKLPSGEFLASGYVSPEGLGQLANLAGLKLAKESSEEPEVQSAIASIFPQLLRGTISEIIWTATKTDQGIEDKYLIGMPAEIASVLEESMRPSGDLNSQQATNEEMLAQIPPSLESATRYNFKDPHVAWRSLLLVANDRLDAVSAKLVGAFGATLFEQYGIRDAEMFLRSLGDGDKKSKNIVTAKLGPESDESVVLAMSGDYALTRKSFISEMKPDWFGEDGYSGLKSKDGDIQVFFEAGMVTLGPSDQFSKLTRVRFGKPNEILAKLLNTSASVATVGVDDEPGLRLIEMLGVNGNLEAKPISTYFTETRFNKTGLERRTVSNFGLIGSIIEQFAKEQ